jgi:hypothetical protein
MKQLIIIATLIIGNTTWSMHQQLVKMPPQEVIYKKVCNEGVNQALFVQTTKIDALLSNKMHTRLAVTFLVEKNGYQHNTQFPQQPLSFDELQEITRIILDNATVVAKL